MQIINQVVSVELHDNTALICLDNPPVNAASRSLRDGLDKAIIWASSQNDIGIVAIYACGHTFVTDADMKEFDKQSITPFLSDLVSKIEQLEIPVISICFLCLKETYLSSVKPFKRPIILRLIGFGFTLLYLFEVSVPVDCFPVFFCF